MPLGAEPARSQQPGSCRQAVFDGSVKAGGSFQLTFTPGWNFLLKAVPAGWIVRIMPAAGPRPTHDAAELATPPYRSVSPLLISTDWAFRAQDALGWNPRRFHYVAGLEELKNFTVLYTRLEHGDNQAGVQLAMRVEQQPEGELQILDATMTPGAADQTRAAAAVASHFEETPHRVVQTGKTSPLGALADLHFRVKLNLPPGQPASRGVHTVVISCAPQPTSPHRAASE